MESLNLSLFGLMAAGFDADPFWLAAATTVAEKSGWLCVAVFAWAGWRAPAERWRILFILLAAGVASVLARKLAQSIGLPRPFMLGLSPDHIEHGARGALPSTHATVMFTMAFMFLQRPLLRPTGWLLFGVALATSWARIYVGVHFPRDILAGLVLGALLALGFDAALGAMRRRLPAFELLAFLRPLGARLSAVVCGDRFSLYFVLLFTAAAFGIGLQAPDVFPLTFFQEGGAVANGTLFFYAAALLMVATLRLPFVRHADKLATVIVLLACTAREAGLPAPDIGMRLLRAGFGDGDASAPKVLIVATLAVVVVAAAWLARRYRQGRRFALARQQWRTAAFTVLMATLVAVFTAALDSLPEMAASFAGTSQAGLGRSLVALEELLELALPMLLMLALFQAGRGQRGPASRR
ncbi:hypothetical protein RD110_02195 [Rhodoferax koreense]|uniref:Phosphatidic acid phosphatase type 2/haloperoxidase domain-containing protein n=1 Tax=Rhodoferax koreensis TaxID=1842727 RepID=A0A1P8JQX6_9BURK|nr:phosphatase PAP2 family protein [Rhodoferax koreense]APW36167.1 hypothetical protein RD110_02195 [Rhodoferax koreense]